MARNPFEVLTGLSQEDSVFNQLFPSLSAVNNPVLNQSYLTDDIASKQWPAESQGYDPQYQDQTQVSSSGGYMPQQLQIAGNQNVQGAQSQPVMQQSRTVNSINPMRAAIAALFQSSNKPGVSGWQTIGNAIAGYNSQDEANNKEQLVQDRLNAYIQATQKKPQIKNEIITGATARQMGVTGVGGKDLKDSDLLSAKVIYNAQGQPTIDQTSLAPYQSAGAKASEVSAIKPQKFIVDGSQVGGEAGKAYNVWGRQIDGQTVFDQTTATPVPEKGGAAGKKSGGLTDPQVIKLVDSTYPQYKELIKNGLKHPNSKTNVPLAHYLNGRLQVIAGTKNYMDQGYDGATAAQMAGQDVSVSYKPKYAAPQTQYMQEGKMYQDNKQGSPTYGKVFKIVNGQPVQVQQ